jgi:hypothetical protein
MSLIAYLGAEIFDGTAAHFGKALLVDRGRFAGIAGPTDLPPDTTRAISLQADRARVVTSPDPMTPVGESQQVHIC